MSSMLVPSETPQRKIVEEIEEGMVKYMSWIYSSPHSRVENRSEFIRLTTDVPDPFINFLLRLRFSEQDVESRMDVMMEFFEARNLPTSCWTGPCCTPSCLGEQLISHGFVRHQELESVGMTIDLDKFNENYPIPEGIAVTRVSDDEGMRLYLSPFERGFEFPKAVASQWGKMDASHGYDRSLPRVNYVATIGGVPVSCTTLFKTSDSAGIYCVATVKEMRRMGAATALIVEALKDAKDEGYRMGLLTAKSLGASVYRRIGFIDQPCKFEWYTWQSDRGTH